MNKIYSILITISVLLIPSVAYAEDGSALLSGSGYAVALFSSLVVVPLVVWLGGKLGKMIDAKVESDMLKSALIRVNTVVTGVVANLSQGLADKFKEASADGKLTDAEKEELKSLALTHVKSLISPSTWTTLSENVGASLSGADDRVEEFLSNEIERSVRLQPKAPKAIKPVTVETDEGK